VAPGSLQMIAINDSVSSLSYAYTLLSATSFFIVQAYSCDLRNDRLFSTFITVYTLFYSCKGTKWDRPILLSIVKKWPKSFIINIVNKVNVDLYSASSCEPHLYKALKPANTPHLHLPRRSPEGATTEWTVITPADEAYYSWVWRPHEWSLALMSSWNFHLPVKVIKSNFVTRGFGVVILLLKSSNLDFFKLIWSENNVIV